MREMLIIDLSALEARLTTRENGVFVAYTVKLINERKEAIARRTRYDRPGGRCIGEVIKTVALESYQRDLDDWPDVAIWTVKGLWGVPVRYGEQRCSEVQAIR